MNNRLVGLAWDFLVSLLDRSHGDDEDVSVDDAATERLALILTSPTLKVARVMGGDVNKQLSFLDSNRHTRLGVGTPHFMENPCLSLLPVAQRV